MGKYITLCSTISQAKKYLEYCNEYNPYAYLYNFEYFLFALEGHSVKDTAKHFNAHPNTVSRLCKRYDLDVYKHFHRADYNKRREKRREFDRRRDLIIVATSRTII